MATIPVLVGFLGLLFVAYLSATVLRDWLADGGRLYHRCYLLVKCRSCGDAHRHPGQRPYHPGSDQGV